MFRLTTSQQQVLRHLRQSAELTAEELARAMGISSVAVRQHLDALQQEGYIAATTERRPVGRPCRLYRTTDRAEELFSKGYAALALLGLECLEEAGGAAGVDDLFRRRRRLHEARLRPSLEGKPLAGRVAELAAAQDRDGYLAEWEQLDDDTFVVRQNNCAICCVARQFPQACQQEIQLYRNLLDAEVERTEHAQSGDPRCTYLIRARPARPRPAPPARTPAAASD